MSSLEISTLATFRGRLEAAWDYVQAYAAKSSAPQTVVNASLTHTLSGATEPYDSQGNRRFHFNGPDIGITSGAVIALAMTLNELCTNTTKFGALSNANGRVDITWTINEEKQEMRLSWTEKGGPPVQRPTRRSFGTRMMESLGQQLNGRVQLSYDPSGLVYLLEVPLRSIVAAV